jgi:medium-chain acyl-[acyl-carrier-protein] hydrolase
MTAKLTYDLWISCPQPNPKAHLRLFCFPCAGGTTSTYSQWANKLPKDVEVCLVHLPGRGKRLAESPYTSFLPLIQTLASVLQPYLNIPFTFFGHSMGATLSFEIARKLRQEYNLSPVHLFACCSPAPQKPILRPFIHKMPEAEFLAELCHRYNAIPQEILQNEELLQLFLPCLKADFTMLETYTYTSQMPLDCPISVFGGLQDKAIRADSLEAWREQTCSSFNLQMFPGDHFFLKDPQSLFLLSLSQYLSHLLAINNH